MATFKSIASLPVADSAEGISLIVNDGGSAKQIPAGQVGAQADWSVADTSSPAYILNKPEIPNAQVQADWNVTDETSPAFIMNKPEISPGGYLMQIEADECAISSGTIYVKKDPTDIINATSSATSVVIAIHGSVLGSSYDLYYYFTPLMSGWMENDGVMEYIGYLFVMGETATLIISTAVSI